MKLFPCLLSRSNSHRRPTRQFRPIGLAHGAGWDLEKRLPPSTWVDFSFENRLFAEYMPWYGLDPNDPTDTIPDTLYFYGASEARTTVETAALPPIDPDATTPQTGSIELTSTQTGSFVVRNTQEFNGKVFIPNDGIWFTNSATSEVEQHWDLALRDDVTGLPPTTPGHVSGRFDISFGTAGGLVLNNTTLSLSFNNEFASVQVNGFQVNASWVKDGVGYSYSGSLLTSSLGFDFGGTVSGGTFSTDASSDFHPEMYVSSFSPDETHATLEWSYSINYTH